MIVNLHASMVSRHPSHSETERSFRRRLSTGNPDYDKECTPALCKIAREAGQEVPPWLTKFEGAKATKTWKVEKAVAALKAIES
jgi:hypothetical protein